MDPRAKSCTPFQGAGLGPDLGWWLWSSNSCFLRPWWLGGLALTVKDGFSLCAHACGEGSIGEKTGGGERDRGRGEDNKKRRAGELILYKKEWEGERDGRTAKKMYQTVNWLKGESWQLHESTLPDWATILMPVSHNYPTSPRRRIRTPPAGKRRIGDRQRGLSDGGWQEGECEYWAHSGERFGENESKERKCTVADQDMVNLPVQVFDVASISICWGVTVTGGINKSMWHCWMLSRDLSIRSLTPSLDKFLDDH